MSRPGYLVRHMIDHVRQNMRVTYVDICICRDKCALVSHLVCGCGGAIPTKRELGYIRNWVESGAVADTYSEFLQ